MPRVLLLFAHGDGSTSHYFFVSVASHLVENVFILLKKHTYIEALKLFRKYFFLYCVMTSLMARVEDGEGVVGVVGALLDDSAVGLLVAGCFLEVFSSQWGRRPVRS